MPLWAARAQGIQPPQDTNGPPPPSAQPPHPSSGNKPKRPARPHHPPLHFQNFLFGAVDAPPLNPTPQNNEELEENFNLANISSNEDEEPPLPRAHRGHPADNLQLTMATDPLMNTQVSQKQAASSTDVTFFFPKLSGQPMSCIIFQRVTK